jgi:hypothetical protein
MRRRLSRRQKFRRYGLRCNRGGIQESDHSLFEGLSRQNAEQDMVYRYVAVYRLQLFPLGVMVFDANRVIFKSQISQLGGMRGVGVILLSTGEGQQTRWTAELALYAGRCTMSHCAGHDVGASAMHEHAGDLAAQFARPEPYRGCGPSSGGSSSLRTSRRRTGCSPRLSVSGTGWIRA